MYRNLHNIHLYSYSRNTDVLFFYLGTRKTDSCYRFQTNAQPYIRQKKRSFSNSDCFRTSTIAEPYLNKIILWPFRRKNVSANTLLWTTEEQDFLVVFSSHVLTDLFVCIRYTTLKHKEKWENTTHRNWSGDTTLLLV